MKRFGIIVDGYSTGSGFAKAFLNYGISCIHVQTQPNIPRVYFHTYHADDYDAHYIFNQDLPSLIQQLKKYNPQFLISGAECGVEIADLLCESLNLPGNGMALSMHRRNKYLMQTQIQSQGLQSIPSFKALSLTRL